MPKQTFFRLSREKRERIEEAAMDEFTQYAFQDTNVNRIIKGAEIPAGSFYQYFEDKKDVFFYLLEKEFYKLEENLGDRRMLAMYRSEEARIENLRLMEEGLSLDGIKLVNMLAKAPDWVKREWAFSVVLAHHKDALYTIGEVPEKVEASPVFQAHRDLFSTVFLGLSVVIDQCTSSPQEMAESYNLFTTIFWEGLERLAERDAEEKRLN